MRNYTVLHCHSELSNLYTTMDSIAKYQGYIDKAKELNMSAIAISEHGNVCSWVNKKSYCDSVGVKYIHAVEAYVTKSLLEKVRDNMHVLLIAKNYKGVEEINHLMSHKVATNRVDGHFYYNPRITFDELLNISENIIMTTACLGGVLNSDDTDLKVKLLDFMVKNEDRCFLEIQHHNTKDQIEYNKLLFDISKKLNLKMVVGTDTHSLNEKQVKGVKLLQLAKDIQYNDSEGESDLVFKSYDELVESYKLQNSLPLNVVLEAIENTNVISDMVETFELDTSIKYPKIYTDGLSILKTRIVEGMEYRKEYIKDIPFSVIKERINMELDTIEKIGAIDFILLEDYVKRSARENGRYCGYARGSASGSFICYLLGITDMNSVRFDLNFFRFLNPNRVSLCDIDTDWYEKDKEWVQEFLLTNEKFNSCYIITYNTIALKGAIRDVARAFKKFEDGKHKISDEEVSYICENVELKEGELREKYPLLFEYVDILNGTVVSFGSHPAGIVVTDRNLESEVGTITLKSSDYPVSCIDMKEIDSLNFVKLDCLGLDNVGVINECCKLVGIERLTPDNVDLNDENVWKSIVEDSTSIFQWESDSAKSFLRKFMSDETLDKVRDIIPNFSMIRWFSYGNGLIRPACSGFRNDIANGNTYDNGLKEINEFLAPTLGRVAMQEDIMMFLVKFCGYSMAEADIVRRGIAKKKGTEKLLPEIESRFISYTSLNYNISKEKCEEIIKPFLQTVKDASAYAFSWNHSDTYSIIGYILGYLRYYYPLEYITSSLNVFGEKTDKMTEITQMTSKYNIEINPPKFRYSKGLYYPHKETNSIYKGIASIKFLNESVGDELYSLRNNKYNSFVELLNDLSKISIKSNQLKILIKLDFFNEFGKSKYLLKVVDLFDKISSKKQFSKETLTSSDMFDLVKRYSAKETERLFKEVDVVSLLSELVERLDKDDELPLKEIFETQKEYVGYISYINKDYPDNIAIVNDLKKNKYGTTFVNLYWINDGRVMDIKVDKRYMANKPLSKYSVITTNGIKDKNKMRLIDGKWVKLDETEKVLESYGFVEYE